MPEPAPSQEVEISQAIANTAMVAKSFNADEFRQQVEVAGSHGFKTFEVSAQALVSRPWDGDDDYKAAVALKNEGAKRVKQIEKCFDPIVKILHLAHKSMTKWRADVQAPWKKLSDDLDEKARKWWVAQHKAKEEAEAAISQFTADERKQLTAQAEELLAMGMVKEAESLAQKARAMDTPILPAAVPKVEGTREVPTWKATVTDLIPLLAAIVAEYVTPEQYAEMYRLHKVPLLHEYRGEERPLVVVDDSVLNWIVSKRGKDAERFLPGVTVEPDVRLPAKRLS